MINVKSIKEFTTGISRLFLLMIAISSAQAYAEAPYYWDHINVDIAVQENGDMLITEEHKYVFTGPHTGKRHRYIPMDKVDTIEDVAVREGDRALDPQILRIEGDLWIRWSHAAAWPSTNVFSIRYRVVGGLHKGFFRSSVHWKAVGHDRDADVLESTVRIRFPKPFQAGALRIEEPGSRTEAAVVDARTVEFERQAALSPGSDFEVHVTFANSALTFSKPSWQEIDMIDIGYLMIFPLGFLLFVGIFIFELRRKEKEREESNGPADWLDGGPSGERKSSWWFIGNGGGSSGGDSGGGGGGGGGGG